MLALALVLLVLAGARAPARPERTFWWLMSGGVGSWLGIRGLYLLVPADAWTVGLDLAQDVGYLLGYLFFALAVHARPDGPSDDRLGARLGRLEVAGTLAFCGGLIAYFIVIPSVFDPAQYSTWVPSLMLYAVLDAYIAFRAVALARSADPRWAWPFRWLAVAFAAWLLVDAAEGLLYLEVLPWMRPATAWDVFWHLPLLAFFLFERSRRWPAPAGVRTPAVDPSAPALRATSRGLVLAGYAVALPAVHFLIGLAGLEDPATRAPREVLLLVVSPGLALLLAYYQYLLRSIAASLEAEGRRVAEQLHTAQRMDAVGRLASGVAHDFSNILSVIRGRAELLVMGHRAGRYDVEDAREIVTASERGQALIGHLLAVGKRRPADPEILDLGEVVAALEPLLERVLPPSFGLTVHAPAGGSTLVHADRAHVEQVLLNLVVNARDAMRDGGALRVTTRVEALDERAAVEKGGAAAGSYVVLEVVDSGPGIPEAVRGQVFEPFFTTKEEGEGTGLGLSIVYGIMRQAGGFVSISDAPEGGARVEAYFPLAEGIPHAAPRAAESRLVVGGESVLVVEGHDALRRTLVRLLERAGYRVISAESAGEALAILERRERIDVLLADVALPDMSGLGLAERASEGRAGLATVFVSNTPEKVTPLRIPAGSSILTKPFSPEMLTFAVRRALDEGRRSVS